MIRAEHPTRGDDWSLRIISLLFKIARLLYNMGPSSKHKGKRMIPIRYQVVGEEDYAFGVEIDDSGKYVVQSGTYTTQPPRTGQLTKLQEDELLQAIQSLGIPREHAMPEGAMAFQAEIIIGDKAKSVTYLFWEGALEKDVKLNKLVRLLERL
jgi:hypothetical protein